MALPFEFEAARAAGVSPGPGRPGVGMWEQRDADTPTPYLWGRYELGGGRSLSMALAQPSQVGGSAVSATVATLVERLDPTLLATCGVCAGDPAETELGDVVVADTVLAWGEGEAWHAEFRLDQSWRRLVKDFDPAGLPSHRSADEDDALRWLLTVLERGDEPMTEEAFSRYFPSGTWLPRLSKWEADGYIHHRVDGSVAIAEGSAARRRKDGAARTGPRDLPFQVLVGSMASGSSVAGGDVWSRARASAPMPIAAFDMEAASVVAVAQRAGTPYALAVKGVTDHAGPEKHDNYQNFAARAAAEVLFALIGQGADHLIGSGERAWSGPHFDKVQSVGLADSRAEKDHLDREKIVDVLYELVTADGEVDADAPHGGRRLGGPAVIAVQGPWGAGKTSLMHLIYRRLPQAPPPDKTQRLTVREAARLLAAPPAEEPAAEPAAATWVPVWFNPWAHQSGEQLWAGLAQAILHGVDDFHHRTTRDAEAYWLRRNAERLDARAIRRSLLVRSVSPAFKFAVWAVLIPLLARLADPRNEFTVGGHVLLNAATFALILPVVLVVWGAVQTTWRYWRAPAAVFLPADLLRGPVLSGVHAESTQSDPQLRDPLYHARSGYLYLYQHDIKRLLADAGRTGHRLVVFIDDLDRCSAQTTADVLSAVNLFLSEEFAHARFVIGLDPVVVAAHVKKGFSDSTGASAIVYGDDPHPGWTFLRKLVQLPVELPPVDDDGLDNVLLHSLGEAAASPAEFRPAPEGPLPPAAEGAGRVVGAAAESPPPPAAANTSQEEPAPSVVSTDFIERSPRVRALLTERLRDQPERSVRETKRLITIWVFYVRLLAERGQLAGDVAEDRACQLLHLAEIAARWPALQRHLAQKVDDRTGIGLLIEAAGDDRAWARTLLRLSLTSAEHQRSCRSLRKLILKHDMKDVERLAQWIR